MKKIYFTVTGYPEFDQRMNRICGTLARNGFEVVLVGRKRKGTYDPRQQAYKKIHLNHWFTKGKSFYLEFNIRIFLCLLFRKMDAICCIDLDTILPCLWISGLKKIPRIYDAHELFCEMQEVSGRPFIYKCWKTIERFTVPKFINGYTVSMPIADEFHRMYGRNYQVIRNVPILQELVVPEKKEKFILYQGAVNEGRCFETLIPAMKEVSATLVICGEGNFLQQAKDLVQANGLSDKIIFKGLLLPSELAIFSREAYIGITLFDSKGKSNYYSLANRFFDYMHAGIPQLCMNYPCYAEINAGTPVAVLIDDSQIATIAGALNNLLTNAVLYNELCSGCLKARERYNWQEEEKKLLAFYESMLK